jgi:hypothetical protein
MLTVMLVLDGAHKTLLQQIFREGIVSNSASKKRAEL